MDNQTVKSDLHKPQSTAVWQKFKNRKFIFLTLGVIIIVFLAIVAFIPEEHLEDKVTPTPPPAISEPRAPRAEDQVILEFKKGVTDEQINERLSQYNATIIKRIDALNLILVEVPKGQGDAMLDAFKKDNLVEEAQPNYLYEASTNDTSYGLQWYLKNTGQPIRNLPPGTPGADINVEAAWTVTKGNGVKIAILDTGIDPNHPDLSSKIVARKNFTTQNEDIGDRNGHGTHLAGIAAAVTDNSVGIAGTCPQCQLMIVKVLGDEGEGFDSSIIAGIIWAADQGAKVINMSLGAPSPNPFMQNAVNYAWGKGVVIIAAAGNGHCTNGEPDDSRTCPRDYTTKSYPAAYLNVFSVAATDNKDIKASFSTFGSWVTVAAPGASIYSTVPTYRYRLLEIGKTQSLNYDYLNGTSMATPIVSGVAGLVWTSSHGTSNANVVQRLCATSDKITGTGTFWSCGRINAGNAVTSTGIPPRLVLQTPTPTTRITPTFNCIGGNPCVPTSAPIPSSSTNPLPTSSSPRASTQPISSGPSSSQPSSPVPPVTRSVGGQPGGQPGGKYLEKLLKIIKELIKAILKLFGIDIDF